jgi:hypothetical protein
MVVNHADGAYVLRYEPTDPRNWTIAVAVPPQSSGAGLGGMEWVGWRGLVVVMTPDCRILGQVEITGDKSLVEIAADGTFSLITDHVDSHPDVSYSTTFSHTPKCLR